MIKATFDTKHFNSVVEKQLRKLKLRGAKYMAEQIIEQMEQNVDAGVGFESGKYDPIYAQRTRRDRKREGYQTGFVDLQRGEKRVKTAYVNATKEPVEIKFGRGGHIMLQHNFGVGDWLPRRQLFPDIQGGGKNSKGNGQLENPSVMRDIADKTEKFGAKLMNE